jgi:signal transduction histidine kinase
VNLADFILRDMENILQQWEEFAAAQVPAATNMNALALRDHAQPILEAVARDIVRPQSPQQQANKSRGLAPQAVDASDTAAQTHALLRARSGFDINQLASEYRALRATVLRLWAAACGPVGTDAQQMIRFNEAIDQALAESIAYFSAEVNQARNLLLGMLGHDMRSPLHAIQVTAAYLAKLNAGAEVFDAASRLINSGRRMKAFLDDLLDFNRTQLGLGITIAPVPVDMAELFESELQLVRAAHPGRLLELESNADGGLGLGLFICRQIATAHGGDVSVRSDETATVFTVRFPRRESTEPLSGGTST